LTKRGIAITEVTFEDSKDYPVVVRMPFDEEPNISDFNKVYFATPTGGQVPLRQVANLHFQAANTEILHEDLNRYTSVYAGVVDADKAIPITVGLLDTINSLELPRGYHIVPDGEYSNQQETFGDLGNLCGISTAISFDSPTYCCFCCHSFSNKRLIYSPLYHRLVFLLFCLRRFHQSHWNSRQ